MLTGVTALSVLAFLAQVHFDALDRLSIAPIHGLELVGLAFVIQSIVVVINFGLFPAMFLAFFVRTFFLRPKIVKNLTNATFLAASFALCHLLQLLLGELSPRLMMVLGRHPTQIDFCAGSYANPNSSVFMSVCFFFLFRNHFFKKSERSENIAQIDTQTGRFFFEIREDTTYQNDSPLHGFRLFNRILDFRSYVIMAWVAIALVCLANYLALLASVVQVAASLLTALHWGYFFHSVVRINVKKYFFNLIREPDAVLSLTRQMNRILLAMLSLGCFLFVVRGLFANAAESALVNAEMARTCMDKYFLERSALLGLLWVFFVFGVNMAVAVARSRETIYNSSVPKLLYYDLSTGDKVRRFVIIFGPPLILLFLHFLIKGILVQTPDYMYLLECVWTAVATMLLGAYVFGSAPYLLFRYSVLLKDEYLFKDALRKDQRSKFESEIAESKTKELYLNSAARKEDVDLSSEALRDKEVENSKGAILSSGIGNSKLVIKVKGLEGHK